MIQNSEIVDILGGAGTAAMAGFSVGGPIGAAIGGIVGGAAHAIKNANNDPVKVYRTQNSIQNAGLDQGLIQSAPAAKRQKSVYSYMKENPNAKWSQTLSDVTDVASTVIGTFGGKAKPTGTDTKSSILGTPKATSTLSGSVMRGVNPITGADKPFQSLIGGIENMKGTLGDPFTNSFVTGLRPFTGQSWDISKGKQIADLTKLQTDLIFKGRATNPLLPRELRYDPNQEENGYTL